ncbi:1,2-phenylacetyl-CoA epoxidase, subunit C [hydrothermal vent metagenome]|uniref:1,2-phenylacetyl-CoA epoxidase, subunit C n=1 Tax=hydrothermal vent metagenome TaxID=652676 RepID=A0A3B0UZC9_9ZZZZ
MSALYNYVLNLADNTLILGQRLSQWCGHGPFLEEDLAMTNTALDLLGQAQMLLNYAAELKNSGETADDLAFLRDAIEFRNVLLVEQPNGDFADTIVRQYFMDVYHVHLYTALSTSSDKQLAAIAEKALKEVNYHLQRSSQWMQRLAHGTDESFMRLQKTINILWHYHHELFEQSDKLTDLVKQNIAPDPQQLYTKWDAEVKGLIATTSLQIPKSGWVATGGLKGHHSEYLGIMLCEMQFLPRAYPNCEW